MKDVEITISDLERKDSWILKRWMYRGYECEILKNSYGVPTLTNNKDWLCGYVGLPKGHKYYEKDYDRININVHGGLTFADKGDGKIWTAGLWWIGFDCAHYNDTISFWNLERVQEEVERLVRQLKRGGKP